jgi:hypothetical protein
VLGSRESGHVRDPFTLSERPVGSTDDVDSPIARVPRENVRGTVGRRMVCDHDDVDSGREMEVEMLLDDVALVADEEGHHDRHDGEP